MGITFRSGNYLKYVRLGGRTIKDGEAAAIWNRHGVHTEIIGPKRVILFCSTIRFLTRFKAESHQYLRVRHRDGHVEVVPGPCNIYENPARHDGISVHDGIHLESSNDCILVFKNKNANTINNKDIGKKAYYKVGKETDTEATTMSSESNQMETSQGSYKRVVRGPDLFIPQDNENIHQFDWSRTTCDGGLEESANKFHVLQTDTGYLWNLHLNVVTADSIKFQAVVALTYHLESLDDCVVAKDPIKKMYTSALADAHVIGNGMSSDELKSGEQHGLTKWLAQETNYPYLCETAKKCGLKIDSIQVTNLIYSSDFEEQMQKEQREAAAISSELANNDKSRELNEKRMEDRHINIVKEAELKRKQAKENASLYKETHEDKLASLERHISLLQKEHDAKQRLRGQEDAAVIDFLKALKTEAGVDVTAFLCRGGGGQAAESVRSFALSKIANIALATSNKEKGEKNEDGKNWASHEEKNEKKDWTSFDESMW